MDLIDKSSLFYPDIFEEPFEISGFPWFDTDKRFVRIPENKAATVSDGLKERFTHTSGGMLRFRTNSKKIVFEAEVLNTYLDYNMTMSASSGFDFYMGNGKKEKFVKIIMPGLGRGFCKGIIENPEGREYDWKINFPLYNGVKSIRIAIEEGASIKKPSPFSIKTPVLFYGSSITQGRCASRPGNAYTHTVCRWLNANFINLGFGNNAKGEPELAELISTIDMSAFVMDYDHNAPDIEHLVKTHEPFFKTIRRAKPDLPVVIISAPDVDLHLDDSIKRRQVIYSTYENAIKQGDRNVYFIDGLKLFGRTERDACTVDLCHPNDLGFMRMAKVIYPVLKKALKG